MTEVDLSGVLCACVNRAAKELSSESGPRLAMGPIVSPSIAGFRLSLISTGTSTLGVGSFMIIEKSALSKAALA